VPDNVRAHNRDPDLCRKEYKNIRDGTLVRDAKQPPKSSVITYAAPSIVSNICFVAAFTDNFFLRLSAIVAKLYC